MRVELIRNYIIEWIPAMLCVTFHVFLHELEDKVVVDIFECILGILHYMMIKWISFIMSYCF